jgi:hypothetical protein
MVLGFFSDFENLGFQEEGIHWRFVGGLTAEPTISYLTTFCGEMKRAIRPAHPALLAHPWEKKTANKLCTVFKLILRKWSRWA